jgi:hypothetical protein
MACVLLAMRSRVLLLVVPVLIASAGACGSKAPAAWVSPSPAAAGVSSPDPAAGQLAGGPAAAGAAADAPVAGAPAAGPTAGVPAPGAAGPAPAGEVPGPARRVEATKAPVTRAAVPKPRPTPAKPQLPAGRAPGFLVGRWTGGPGDQTGRYLTISAAGRYERGFNSGRVESSGTVIADQDTATFYDTGGGKESAGLTYTDAAGIIVLSVDYAVQGYYSYVPN